MRPLTFLLTGLPTLAPATLGLAQEPPSLEDLLRDTRERRAAVAEELSIRIEAAIAEIEDASGLDRDEEAGVVVRALVAMGPAAAPLLVAHLDPGVGASNSEGYRAERVVDVLRAIGSPAITDDLLALLEGGSLAGRRNVLRVLETSTEPERVVPAVQAAFRANTGSVREAAVLTLGHLGGTRALGVLREALGDESQKVVDAAVRTLGLVPGDAVAGLVLEHLGAAGAAESLGALATFYELRSGLLEDEEHQMALAGLLVHPLADVRGATAFLESWTRLEVEPRPAVRRALEPLKRHVDVTLREATLVFLARNRDKGARRDLLRPYDDRIDRQRGYPGAWTSRGDALYRLGEFTAAIKDYREAIDLMNPRNKKADPYIGAARCYARREKFKEARDYLQRAPLGMDELQALAEDPAFAEMLTTRYRDVFRLPQ